MNHVIPTTNVPRRRLTLGRSMVALFMGAACFPVVSYAQEPPVPRFCVIQRPGCRATAVTETFLGVQSAGETTALTIGFEGALMRNTDHGAIGLSAYWAYQSHGHRWGVKPRWRRWLDDGLSLDLSGGLILNSGEDRFDPTYPGFVFQVNAAWNGVDGVMGRVEFLRGDGGSSRDITLGVQLGAKTGAAGGLLLLILGVMTNAGADRVYIR